MVSARVPSIAMEKVWDRTSANVRRLQGLYLKAVAY